MATKPKKKTRFAANAASLRFLKKQGFIAGTVEKWLPFTKQRKDLFGFIDVIAIDKVAAYKGAIAIQTTTSSNVAARRDKILAIPDALLWLKCENRIWIHSWAKRRIRPNYPKQWSLVVHEVTLGDFK